MSVVTPTPPGEKGPARNDSTTHSSQTRSIDNNHTFDLEGGHEGQVQPVTSRVSHISQEEEFRNDPHCVNFTYQDPQDPRTLPEWKKWSITLIALSIQMWANAISSMAAPAIEAISPDLDVSVPAGRVIQAIFLYGFALGAVVLTPLSEDYGRRPTHIASTALMGIFQIPCALAPNFGTMVAFRFIAGFFAAATFNSVGIISDMWDPDNQSWPVNSFALAAELGAEVGPIIGGFILINAGWRWIFGVAGLGSAFLLGVFILFCPETRSGVILKRRAAKVRKETGDDRFFAHHEIVLRERTLMAILQETLFRPVYMLFREPIVLWFAIFDGFNYMIIYLALESIPLVYQQWGFSEGELNLPFIGMFLGSCVAFGLYYFQLRYEKKEADKNDGEKPPESRLFWMIPGGIIFPASLFWFAWTSQGPPVPWIVSVLALGAFGLSSHIIFISVSDYTIASYSIYSASAVGAQSLLREILSGSVTLFSHQMYVNLGYQWASTVLAFIAVVLAIVPPILYIFGPRIRAASAFALEIQQAEKHAKQIAHQAKLEFDRSNTEATARETQESTV
ncbi:MFS general substrate transporter [Meira miltonrushii]|uniref:MFS general substrate transporter n=1 Tax=Meira miltonrushii TaxID=1280837 RepID=A0A316VAN5_9BASI|nr:MFS general substrate transporter [Meira miltonrushii]PWN34510.1 MFS general substrate transporter [Meira miltonrushii]